MYSFITAWYQWHLVYQRLLTSRNSLLGHAVAISYAVVRARVRQFSQPPMIHIQTNIHSFPTCFVVLYDWTNKNLAHLVFIVYTAPITGKTASSFTGKYLPAYDRLFKRDGRKLTENYGKQQLLVFCLLIYSYKYK